MILETICKFVENHLILSVIIYFGIGLFFHYMMILWDLSIIEKYNEVKIRRILKNHSEDFGYAILMVGWPIVIFIILLLLITVIIPEHLFKRRDWYPYYMWKLSHKLKRKKKDTE